METILLHGDEKKTRLIIQLSKEMGMRLCYYRIGIQMQNDVVTFAAFAHRN